MVDAPADPRSRGDVVDIERIGLGLYSEPEVVDAAGHAVGIAVELGLRRVNHVNVPGSVLEPVGPVGQPQVVASLGEAAESAFGHVRVEFDVARARNRHIVLTRRKL